VGDFLKVGDTTGTIDDVGFRSTRIRTLDRTMVSVPNGQVANLVLESYSARDKFWFHPILNLHRSTTSPQMQAVLESIRSLLRENQSVETNSIRVRFIRLGLYSLDVEVFAYNQGTGLERIPRTPRTPSPRRPEVHRAAGVQIALPSQSVFLATKSPSTDPEIEATSTAPAQFKKTKLLSSLQSG
jgi:MscS family membrane protein